MPDPRSSAGDFLEPAAAFDAFGRLLDDLTCRPSSGVGIVLFDQEPIFFVVVSSLMPRVHADQCPGAMQLVAVQLKLQHAPTVPVVGIDQRVPDAAVPDQNRSGTILLRGNDPFEFG